MHFYMHSYLHKNFILVKSGCYSVPNIKELKDKILREAHKSAYSIHSGWNKMYHDLKATYWWMV
jgi:hypothetical protein